MRSHRAIVLAAGKSQQMDGLSKVLIRHPTTGKTVLDYAIEAFGEDKVCVAVGYRAIEIMQQYPKLQYAYNPNWALTNNAMSLGLALTEEPSYVVSGDIFLAPELITRLDAIPNAVLTSPREKRSLSAVHCVLDEQGRLIETYQGPVRNMQHPEAVGLFKLSDKSLLREWKRRCLHHSNLFVGQLAPCDIGEIVAVELEDELFFEINTPTDYLHLIESSQLS